MKYFKIFLKSHKGKLFLSVLLLLCSVVGTLLIPTLIANVVDQGILQGDVKVITRVGLQMLLVALAGSAISVFSSWVTSDLGALFGREMRSKLFKKIQELSVHQFDQLGVSSLLTRSTSDITNLQQTLGMMLQIVAPAPLILVASMIMTFMISPMIALIQFASIVLMMLASVVLLKKSNALSRSIQRRLDLINKVVRESITGVRVIRAFGNEAYEEHRSGKAYESYAENMIHLNRLFAVATPMIWLAMGAVMLVILGLGGAFSLKGTMAVGQITAVIEYTTMTMGYLISAASAFTTLPKTLACLGRLQEVLDMEPAIKDNDIAPGKKLKQQEDAIVAFNHVSFSYPGAEEPVIHDLSFKIMPGQTTAVIGSTGSGKSTIADLLLRIHDIQQGSITLGGTDIRSLSQQSLRDRIGCVPQKAFLFSGTIADNLRMGNEQAADRDLWTALRIAQAENFVKGLPKGLNSPVAQGGTNFSGGQRQRLSIARALVKKADVFLFDDSFSALDVKTDAALRTALRQNVKTSAKLVIAQRISSILDADQILVLDKGCLVGIGTHDILLKNCSVYRAIAESQMNEREA